MGGECKFYITLFVAICPKTLPNAAAVTARLWQWLTPNRWEAHESFA